MTCLDVIVRASRKKLTFVLGCAHKSTAYMHVEIIIPPAYNIRRMFHSIDINNSNIKRLKDTAEVPHESTTTCEAQMHSEKTHTHTGVARML